MKYGTPDLVQYIRRSGRYMFSRNGHDLGSFSIKSNEFVYDFMVTDFERDDGASLGVVFLDDDTAEVLSGTAVYGE